MPAGDHLPVHLVGLSMGGVQALEYAARRPERVTDLVLADTFAGLPAPTARGRVDGMTASVEALGMAAYADQYIQQTLVRPVPDADRAALRAAIAGMSPAAYLASAEVTFLTDHTPILGAIEQAALVLVGEEDHKSPVALAAHLASGLPNAELRTIPRAGHLSNIENPDAFTTALTGFFTSTTVMETTS